MAPVDPIKLQTAALARQLRINGTGINEFTITHPKPEARATDLLELDRFTIGPSDLEVT